MNPIERRRAVLERIRERAERQRLVRQDPRFKRVLGCLVNTGLLVVDPGAELPARASRSKLRIGDVLWAGEVEPRMLEVLPALLLERPELFRLERQLPEDLKRAVDAVRLGLQTGTFRGIPWAKLARHRKRAQTKDRPAKLHAFRLRREDELLLSPLAHELDTTQTDVLRKALGVLAERVFLAAPLPLQKSD